MYKNPKAWVSTKFGVALSDVIKFSVVKLSIKILKIKNLTLLGNIKTSKTGI